MTLMEVERRILFTGHRRKKIIQCLPCQCMLMKRVFIPKKQ